MRKIAQSHNLNIIELGYYFEDYFNSLTAEDVAAYNAENGTSFTSQVELVKSWYGDHNHYKQYLADKIGSYILDSVSKIAAGSTDFNQANVHTSMNNNQLKRTSRTGSSFFVPASIYIN